MAPEKERRRRGDARIAREREEGKCTCS